MNWICNKINTDWFPKLCVHIFVHESTALEGIGLCVVSLSHSDTAYSVGLVYTKVTEPLQKAVPDTQHSKATDVHAPGGIRTRNLSNSRSQ